MLGDVDGALAQYRDMLKLNPNDNQGIRYVLAGCLLRQDNYSALKEARPIASRRSNESGPSFPGWGGGIAFLAHPRNGFLVSL